MVGFSKYFTLFFYSKLANRGFYRGLTKHESRNWVEHTRNSYWDAGVDPSAWKDALGSIVQCDDQLFRREPTPFLPGQYGRLRHSFANRTIIGAQLENSWDSGTNASWRLLDGWVGEHAMEVEFCTQHFRGGMWHFRVWSVVDSLCH